MGTGGIITIVVAVFVIVWLVLGRVILGPKDKTDGWGIYLFFLTIYPILWLLLCIMGDDESETAYWD